MNQQQPQPSNMVEDTKNAINWLMIFVHIYSTAIEVFLHLDMGHRYLGFQAAAVLLVVPLHTFFFKTRDPSATAWFLLFYLLACFAQRCNHWDRRKSGVVIHSYSNGYPWLRGMKSKVSEIAFKTWVEPTVVAVLGVLLRQYDEANSSFLLTCAAAMCFKNLVGQHINYEEVTDMHDSLIEQQQKADRFRESTSSDRTQWR